MKQLKIYTMLCISSFLVACGGGGGSSDGASPARVDVRPVNPGVIEQPLPAEKLKPEEKPPILVQPIIPPVVQPIIPPVIQPEPKKPLPVDKPISGVKPIEKEKEILPNPKVEDKAPIDEKPLPDREPIIAPEQPVIEPKPKKDENVDSNEVFPVPNLKREEDKNLTGKGVTVAVLDSDFKSPDIQSFLEKEFGDRLTALEKEDKQYNGSEHGSTVSSILGGKTHGVAKEVNIVASSIGKMRGIHRVINVRKKDYEQILASNSNIKIFNQSFGRGSLDSFLKQEHPYIYLSDDRTPGEFLPAIEFFDFYKNQVKEGKLFIWAAGNYLSEKEGGSLLMKDPSLYPALPYIVREKYRLKSRVDSNFVDLDARNLSDGWLAVVGIDPATKKHYTQKENSPILGHLAYAGRAKEWSISAFAHNPYKNDADDIGSSYAAPRVSAAAALVSQKYPWMDGNNIKQTLLTTADIIDDMEQPSVSGRIKQNLSDKYGWGLLNIEKALNGPSEFSDILNKTFINGNTHFKANLGNTGIDSVFSNEITGWSGLIKQGEDKLILSRNNSYVGSTLIRKGKLELWGNSRSKMEIYKGAELILKNNLTIMQNVYNSGTLNIKENSEPTLLEDYTADKNSTTQVAATSKLFVKGQVNIDPNAKFDLTLEDEKYIPKNDLARELIVSELAIQGSFKANDRDNLVEEEIKTLDNKVVAHISRKDTEEYARKHSSDTTTLNVARNLELAFNKIDEKIQSGDTNIEALTKEAALLQATSLSLSPTNTNFDSLSGQIYASAQSLTFKQAEFVNKEIANRLATLGMLEASDKKYGAWMSTFYSKADLEKAGYAKANTHLSGNQFGFDKKFKDSILGLSFVHSNAKADFNRYSGHASSESYGLSLYGRKNFYADKLYLQGKISAHTIKTNVDRAILNTYSSIKHKDLMLSSFLESGYNFRLDRHTLSPFIAIESNRLRRNSFSENSSSFALKADKKLYQQNILKLGVREQYQFYTNSKISNTLSMYLLQNFNLSDRSLDFDAKFNTTNTNVKVKGIGLGPNSTHFGLGLVTEFSPNIATYANFDLSMERKKIASTMYTLGLRWSF